MGPYRFTTQPFLSMRNCRVGGLLRVLCWGPASTPLLPHLSQGPEPLDTDSSGPSPSYLGEVPFDGTRGRTTKSS